MSQTPRTPERNRQQEHPSTPATISQTLRAGAVAVVTAPLTVPRGFLRYLGLITSGDASSTDPAVQQLNFELEGESRSAAGIESAEIARPAGINVAHGNGADSARQRTTDEILLEGPTTVNEDEDVASPPSLRLSTKGDPDRSPIVLFPNHDTGERSRAEANASNGDTPPELRSMMATMEKMHDSFLARIASEVGHVNERLRVLEERGSLMTSKSAESEVDISDDVLDSGDESFDDDEDPDYTEADFAALIEAKRKAATCAHVGCSGCPPTLSASGGDGVPGNGWTKVVSKKGRRESTKSFPSTPTSSSYATPDATPASSSRSAGSSTGSSSTGLCLQDTNEVTVGVGAGCNVFQFLSDEAVDIKEQMGVGTQSTIFIPGALQVQFPKQTRPLKDNTKDHLEFQAKITKGLTKPFGTASYAETRSDSANFKGGQTGADIAELTMEKLSNVNDHAKIYDMSAIILVPELKPGVDTNMSDAALRDAHPTALFNLSDKVTLLNLTKEWGVVELSRVCFWQRYINVNKYVLQDDRDSNNYFWLFLVNSMTHDLKEQVMETLNTTFASDNTKVSCIGGATLLYALIQASFGQSRSVFESYAQRITDFELKGLRGTEGENMALKAKSLLLIINCLFFAKYLHSRMIDQLLDGLQKCSCPDFVDYFRTLSRDKLRTDLTSTLTNTLLDARPTTQLELYTQMKSIIIQAKNLYLGLCERKRWNTKGKDLRYNVAGSGGDGGGNSKELICPNCNGGHKLKECTLERNEERLKKIKEEFKAFVKAEGGHLKDGKVHGIEKGKWREFWAKKRSLDEARKKKEGILTGSSKQGGVPSRDSSGNTQVNHKFHQGSIKFRCTKCSGKKRWGSHTTDLHDLAVSQGASFDIVKEKPNDPAVQAFAALRQAKQSSGGAGTSSSAGASGGAKMSKEEWTQKMATVAELIESKAPGSEEHKSAMNTFRLLSAKVKDF